MYCPKCGDPIEKDEKFCNKCGTKLYENPSIDNLPKTDENKNKKNIIIGFCVGTAVVFIFAVIFITLTNKSKYYYLSDDYDEYDKIVEEKNTYNQQNSKIKSGKYSTVIITDNVYTGVNIKTSDDAYSLISKDSVIQKNNCPSEMKKIENDIIEKYGITAVNLCELDLDFAKEIENVIDTVFNEYPVAKKYLTNITLINGTMSNSYIAAFMPIFNFASANTESGYPWVIKTQVLLNTSYFLNEERLQSSVTSASLSGHFPPNTTKYSPIAHEFGHYLSFIALLNSYQLESILLVDSSNVYDFYQVVSNFANGDFSLEMINEAYNNYKNDTNTTMTLDEWRGTISNYALAKDNSGEYIYDETIAESFHDVYLNGNNAADASKYVVKVLKSKLGG